MGSLIRINQENITFSLEEAVEVLPIVKRIVAKHEVVIQKLLKEQRYALDAKAGLETIKEYDKKLVNEQIAWGSKLTRMGLRVSGGYVYFNTGTGWYVWLIGHDNIQYYLEHGKGLESLIKITPEAILS